jgi:hypothetical protein
MFWLFLFLVIISLFALPTIAVFDVLFSKDDGLTDFERSAALIDRK